MTAAVFTQVSQVTQLFICHLLNIKACIYKPVYEDKIINIKETRICSREFIFYFGNV